MYTLLFHECDSQGEGKVRVDSLVDYLRRMQLGVRKKGGEEEVYDSQEDVSLPVSDPLRTSSFVTSSLPLPSSPSPSLPDPPAPLQPAAAEGHAGVQCGGRTGGPGNVLSRHPSLGQRRAGPQLSGHTLSGGVSTLRL